MTLLDKLMASTTPGPSDEERTRTRHIARLLADDHPWLDEVIRHHVAIEDALDNVRLAADAPGRRHALRWLRTLLTGHFLAEETVLYPAMAQDGLRVHAVTAYADDSGTKIELAALETMDVRGPDFADKLERLRGELAWHLHEEETTWFPALCRAGGAAFHGRLTGRFVAEFERYMGVDGDLL
ncbi:MAG TPA: hemerythrin domain-containing protein [Burkholderiaceae bacterium]